MNAIDKLAAAGTSTWLDDLSRDRISSGNLQEVIAQKSVVGVTTNPAIFANAMSTGTAYDEQIAELKGTGVTDAEATYAMSIRDVQDACDIFAEIYRTSGGKDGRVSIEVDPRIADLTEETLEQARDLWKQVNRPNAMIKIPATVKSIPAITAALAEGISVNVTLIFSVERYRAVMEAFYEGLTKAAEADLDISQIHSVASFFVSRVDTEIDKRLETIGTEEALALRGKAGLANARLAYAAFEEFFAAHPLPEGGNIQRPLWASTGVKNPEYPKDLYVVELAGPNTVNTMPEGTIDATLDADRVSGDTLSGTKEASQEVFNQLSAVGIDLDDVFDVLETEGVEKFVESWNALLARIETKIS